MLQEYFGAFFFSFSQASPNCTNFYRTYKPLPEVYFHRIWTSGLVWCCRIFVQRKSQSIMSTAVMNINFQLFHSCFLLSVWWKLCAWAHLKCPFPRDCPEHFSTFLLPQRLRSYTKVFGAVHKSDFGLITWECCILDTWFWDEMVPDFLLLTWSRVCSNYPNSFMFPVFLVLEFWLVSSVLFFPSTRRHISNNLSLNLLLQNLQ